MAAEEEEGLAPLLGGGDGGDGHAGEAEDAPAAATESSNGKAATEAEGGEQKGEKPHENGEGEGEENGNEKKVKEEEGEEGGEKEGEKDKEKEGDKKEKEKDGEKNEKDKPSRDKSRERRRRSSRSRSRGRREKDRDRRRDRKRSRSRSGDRKRGRDKDRDRRRRRSESASRSPSPRRRKRREKVSSNWDKPPEPGQVPFGPPGSVVTSNPGFIPAPSTTIGPAGLPISTIPGTKITGIGTMAGMPAPSTAMELFNGVMVSTNQVRQAKRLYIGNVPLGCDQYTLMELFNRAMIGAGKSTPATAPVVGVQTQPDKNFAFIETRTPEDAAAILLFDGISLGTNCLKVRRPKDFKPLPGVVDPPAGATVVPGAVSTTVPDSENKIYLGSIPVQFNEIQVRELVSAFGELKAFNLVKDSVTGASRGYCFFEYTDASLTDRVCMELNNFELGDKKLVCQRANTQGRGGIPDASLQAFLGMSGMGALAGMGGMINPALLQGLAGAIPGLAIPGGAAAAASFGPATKILKLSNMVIAEELKDDQEYEEIVTDIREECSKYGEVLSLKIPRPIMTPAGEIESTPPGVGEVYVEFSANDGAEKAANALRNRQFSNRIVLCGFFDENEYAAGNLK